MSAPLLPAANPWAQGVLAAAAGLDVPTYGSPEWHALPYDSPARIAAAVLAAEVHRYEVETLADRLRIELDVLAADDRDEEEIATAARAAMARDDELAAHARKVATSAARQLLAAAAEPFAEPTTVRDTDGWPPVRQPGQATQRPVRKSGPGALGLPPTAVMLRRIS